MSKKELDIEDLKEVTGGVNPNRGCSHFLQNYGYPNERKCANCFYTNVVDGQNICTHPSQNKKQKTAIA